ncbi:class I SAM-dependent methyltransferase, partial [Arthrospira platensis SPKY1]|nr:class I SAM-dependent methyltransferase [Arthrospira platensis SPKY1]
RRARIQDINISVLDVGCGLGDRLLALRSVGLSRLEGVDPFIESDVMYPNGVRIFKKSVFEVSSEYDLITLHHSFEHMYDQITVLRKLRELLAPQGVLLLRIPVTAEAWKEYGVHWVQIDAPRHLYLHTVASLGLAARKAGLRIDRVDFDSTAFQFWGSEQYRRDITLYDPRSYEFGLAQSIFNPGQIAEFARRSRELNQQGKEDQACFYLRKEPL